MKTKLKRLFCIFFAFLLAFTPILTPSSANAKLMTDEDNEDSSDEDSFRSISDGNNIIFYDPNECYDSGGGSSYTSAAISGYEIKEKVWSGLQSKGYTAEVIAGIMGNMQAESNFNPARYEQKYRSVWTSGFDWENSTEEGHGVGLVQWSGSRRVNFFQYMRTEGNPLVDKYLKDPNTYGGLSGENFLKKANNDSEVNGLISLEINFLDSELIKTSNYKGIFDQKTVEDATRFFAENVEVCENCKRKSENGEDTDTMKNRIKAANEIYGAFANKVYTNGETANITSDFSNIFGAKNANESVSAVSQSSEWYAGWSDTNTASLKRVLEHYGDLAYQTGRALNVPWQAILVQMRYENPRAMCGSRASPNNFWGMGCTKGATAESLENLGRGFEMYAKYVTNGNYNAAIGLTDPKEYLEVLGPMWVQGKASGAGYSEINNMKKSLDVLEKFIQTPEGQAVVNTFGHYSSSYSSGDDCCGIDDTALTQGGGTYKGGAYSLNDEDLDTLIRLALNENGGSLEATKSELSLMANRYQKYGEKYSDVLDYVINSGWFGVANHGDTVNCPDGRHCPYKNEISDELRKAAIGIIRNGMRTIPLEIVQHATFGSKYISISDNGAEGNADDRSQYKSGVTLVHEKFDGGGDWMFWNWADQTNSDGDPFGYEINSPPSESTLNPSKGSTSKTTAGSKVTWSDDGWIKGGIETYYKDSLEDLPQQDTWGAEYITDSLSTKHKGKGPNKILLHATEGGSDGGKSVHHIYADQTSAAGNEGKSVPPHFTIDIKNKIIYQHQSIWKSSAAIVSTKDDSGNGDRSAGIQIEIVGYDYGGQGGDWDLTNGEIFTASEWDYLAEFLNAISVETGIPLTSSVDWSDGKQSRMTDWEKFKNYQGILSHKHAPPDNDHSDISEAVWKQIESAISSYQGSQQNVCGGSGDLKSFQRTVLSFAWSEYQTENMPNRMKPKEDYYKAIHKEGAYRSRDDGADCGVFVTAVIRESGWDPNYNSANGNTTSQLQYVQDPKNGWTDVTSTIKSNKDARPGDVLLTKENYTGHTLLYVGEIPGFGSVMASASLGQRVGMADYSHDIMSYINGNDGLGRPYYVFRKVK